MTDPDFRPYEPDGDADALWALKSAFERELGTDPEKAARYEAKLDTDYRDEYLAWVERCVDEEDCVQVAEAADDELIGYVFLLPTSLAYIWDAAVLNEVYVAPAHRGTGLADTLMAWAVDYARTQSLPLDRLVLDVDRGNHRAKHFYERHGFTHWGEMVAREL